MNTATYKTLPPVLLMMALIAVIYLILPALGVAIGPLEKSITEPLRLLRVLMLDVIPANLVWIAAVLWLLVDKGHLSRLAPQLAEVISERVKMTIVMGLLAIQYTKLTSVGALSKSETTSAILAAFGAASIGFTVAWVLTAQRYLAMRAAILRLGQPVENEEVVAPQRSWPPKRFLYGGVAAVVAVAVMLFLWAPSPGAPEHQKTISPKGVPPPTEPLHYNQELVERLTVGSQPKDMIRGGNSAGERGDLPEGLRFNWKQDNAGWEPAFIKRARDGSYWWRGQRVAAGDPILKAFALEGPAVRPDAAEGILYFHKDVLSAIYHALMDQGLHQANPSISVDRQGSDVVLKISSAGNRPSQTIIISANI
jgi:hypothetical protein